MYTKLCLRRLQGDRHGPHLEPIWVHSELSFADALRTLAFGPYQSGLYQSVVKHLKETHPHESLECIHSLVHAWIERIRQAYGDEHHFVNR